MDEVSRIPLWFLFLGFVFGVSERTIVAVTDPTVGNITLWLISSGFMAIAAIAVSALILKHSS
jgi:hypothetical protein